MPARQHLAPSNVAPARVSHWCNALRLLHPTRPPSKSYRSSVLSVFSVALLILSWRVQAPRKRSPGQRTGAGLAVDVGCNKRSALHRPRPPTILSSCPSTDASGSPAAPISSRLRPASETTPTSLPGTSIRCEPWFDRCGSGIRLPSTPGSCYPIICIVLWRCLPMTTISLSAGDLSRRDSPRRFHQRSRFRRPGAGAAKEGSGSDGIGSTSFETRPTIAHIWITCISTPSSTVWSDASWTGHIPHFTVWWRRAYILRTGRAVKNRCWTMSIRLRRNGPSIIAPSGKNLEEPRNPRKRTSRRRRSRGAGPAAFGTEQRSTGQGQPLVQCAALIAPYEATVQVLSLFRAFRAFRGAFDFVVVRTGSAQKKAPVKGPGQALQRLRSAPLYDRRSEE